MLTNYELASEGFTICTHTTPLTFDLTSDQEKLPRVRVSPSYPTKTLIKDEINISNLDCLQVLPALSRLLPPPSCPPADQPRSLDDRDPPAAEPSRRPPPSVPVEHDEQHGPPTAPPTAAGGPRECSQSEVTYLSDVGGAVDLYCSWPVQCSCPAEAGGGVACEDCRANGFTSDATDDPQGERSGCSGQSPGSTDHRLNIQCVCVCVCVFQLNPWWWKMQPSRD